MILEMAASGSDRLAVTAGRRSLTAAGLLRMAHAAADRFQRYPAVLYVGANHLAYPVALFGAPLAEAGLAAAASPGDRGVQHHRGQRLRRQRRRGDPGRRQ
jgi:hypothetical protein